MLFDFNTLVLVVIGWLLLIISGLGYIFLRSRKLTQQEKVENLIYRETCGAKVNNLNLTWPFVRLAIYNDFIMISYFKKILLNINDIIEIKKVRNIISEGLQLIHNSKDLPKSITIWSLNPNEVYKVLNKRIN